MDVVRITTSDDEQRLLVVYAIQRILAFTPDEVTLLRESCALLACYRHYRAVWAGLVQADGSILGIASAGAAAEYLEGRDWRLDDMADGEGTVGWVLRHRRGRVVRITDDRSVRWRDHARVLGIASLFTLPVCVDDRVVCVISAYSDEPAGFDQKERNLLEGLGQDIARALNRLRLRASTATEVERSRDRLRRLEALRRLFTAGDGSIDARGALLLSEGTRSLGMDIGALGYLDGEQMRYQFCSLDRATPQATSVPVQGSIAAVAIREGRTRSWQDIGGSDGLPLSVGAAEAGYRSAIVTPFEIDRHQCALVFLGREPRAVPFQEEDHAYVERLASLFAQFARQNAQEEQIRKLRAFDQLTGLPNRASLETRLSEMVGARDAAAPFAVIGIDLDRFRSINTALGYATGDRVLVECARRIRSVLREGDMLARLGSDSFGVIAHARTPDAAADVARRLCDCLGESTSIDGNEVLLSASVGVALYPSDARDATQLLACAASAIAAVRAQGGGRYRFFSHEIGERLEAKRRFHRDVIRAREKNEFNLYFQPQVDLRTGEVAGAEALLRWHDAELGVRDAGNFITLAEETGSIYWMDHWALRATIDRIRRWEAAGREIVVACNISGRSVDDPSMLDELRALIAGSGIDPSHLQLELTETVAMRDVAATSAFLQSCRAMGVTVALDDFGTGYSSLTHLKRLPVDTIKIDGTFVRELPDHQEDAAIVRAIIALGHSLGRRVVGECVEREDQARWLTEHGCDIAQGHLYAEAMPVERFEEWMDAR